MDLYLGKKTDSDEQVQYPSKHLTTHGLIFGMTGSGKTGLAIGMLEEAQRQGIPIIAIDPKGDLTNLALAWPDLAPEGFAHWLDPARLEGANAAELGQQFADTWRNGLSGSGLGPDDIAAMRQRAHLTVYTPGSTSGVPVSLLRELAAPRGFETLNEEDRQELVSGVVGAVLSLVRIPVDPLQSREFILLSNLISQAWARGESLDLPTLVQRVDTPPFAKLGVFDLDDFFPPRRRREFAMQLNGLIASPAFKAWLEGPPLDLEMMLTKEDGKQRTSIFYLAHLDDSERMSFVTLLLERVIAWMRQQPGTGALRALVYMDEVFGYLPPHPSNPPSKRPIMTLLKQARAFGVGVVLATQNPVDVDYKALTNAGTWLIGKLQAEQDRERVLDGLMSAQTGEGAPTRSEISRLVTSLEGRQFVLQSAHEPGPTVFKSRFAMSFLRGPMTRGEVARLKDLKFYNSPEVAGLNAAAQTSAPAPVAPKTPPSDPTQPTGSTVEAGPRVPESPGAPFNPWARKDSADGATPTTTAPTSAGWQAEVVAAPPKAAPTLIQLPARYLSRAARSNPAVIAALGLSGQRTETYETWLPALFGEATVRFELQGSVEPTTISLQRIAFPLGDRALSTPWREVMTPIIADSNEPQSFSPTAPPAWVRDGAQVAQARELFEKSVTARQNIVLPVCPPLNFWGQPGEGLEAFRMRLGPMIGQARDMGLDKLERSKDLQASIMDRKVAEMKELLEMDRRELAHFRATGDAEALKKATIRTQMRIEKYKELQATREKFVGLAQRDIADVEFSALDKLEAAELRAITVQPQRSDIVWLGILWIPANPL